jgi:glycosyltransferase involved in cell wall biosynthesis
VLSVIIPALNEEDAIGETVRAVDACLTAAGIEHEVIVIDDGSSDATGRIAAERGAQVIRHLYNLGYGRSIKDGIRAARHDLVAITDADGTYPIHELPRLYAHHVNGFDMTVGQRIGEEYRESMVKAPLRSILKLLVEYTAGRSIPDINSGLRIINRAMAMRFFSRLCDTFSFSTSLTLAFIMNGLYVEHVPIEYYERKGKSKVRLLRDSINTLQYVAEAAIYYNPLRIFLAFSIGLVAFDLILILINLFLQRAGLLLAIIGVFLTSILTLGLGLIAVLLKQILISREAEVSARAMPNGDPVTNLLELERSVQVGTRRWSVSYAHTDSGETSVERIGCASWKVATLDMNHAMWSGPMTLLFIRHASDICSVPPCSSDGNFDRQSRRLACVVLLPQSFGDFERVDIETLPPVDLIAALMQLPVMTTAKGHGEFIADLHA